MSKIVLGIITGILIFIAAGILANYWVSKMRREMEERKPRVAENFQMAPAAGLLPRFPARFEAPAI